MKTEGERFWDKVDVSDIDSCWLWTGATNGMGYGKLTTEGRQVGAHRLCLMRVLSLDNPEVVRHKCDVKLCVNPWHLEPGTQKDNVHDCIERGRRRYGRVAGERHGRSKLTREEVLEIRADLRLGKIVAEEYGISPAQVSLIRSRQRWKHLE